MKYLFLFALFIATPALAQIAIDDGIRSPQSLVVAGDSIIDDDDDDNDGEDDDDDITDTVDDDISIDTPILPDEPIDPFSKAPEVSQPQAVTKKVFKKVSPVKIKRSIADDRIDDSYVQGLIKQSFDFSNPIE